jgi:hypothetical protein
VQGFRKYAALLAVLTGVAFAIVGCSGSGGSGGATGGSSPAGTATYTNDQYGFSITPDAQFTQGEPVQGTGTGGASVLDVVFADKNGTTVADRYVDAIQVSVYALARSVKPAEVPKLKKEVQGVVDQMMSSISTGKIVAPLEEVTVNGVPGFAFKYTYTQDGQPVTAVAFFLVKGKYEYQVTAQAASGKWDALKGKLEGAVQTFKAR